MSRLVGCSNCFSAPGGMCDRCRPLNSPEAVRAAEFRAETLSRVLDEMMPKKPRPRPPKRPKGY